MLRTRVTLKPGQPGTKQMVAEYGDRLLCVRYRYDDQLLRRLKTVEVIVEESPWTPTRPFNPSDLVEVHIRPHERTLHRAATLLGIRTTLPAQPWRTTYAVAAILHLTPRARRPASTHIHTTHIHAPRPPQPYEGVH